MSKLTSFLFPCLIILLALYIALNAKIYVPVTIEGITLWALSVLPPLFPFFVLSSIVSESGFPQKICGALSPLTRILYNADGVAAYTRIISIISGYPVGIKAIADLKQSGIIDSVDAADYSVFSSTSGFNFIMGFVGLKFGGYGTTLFLIHAFSSLLTGFIFSFFSSKQRRRQTKNIKFEYDGAKRDLGEIVASSVLSILYTGGFVVCFYLFARILNDLNLTMPLRLLLSPFLGENAANGLITGLIECTTGCSILSKSVTPLSLSLASSVVSFGGLSVIFQSCFYLKKSGAGLKKFLLAKIIQSVISFFIARVVFFFVF